MVVEWAPCIPLVMEWADIPQEVVSQIMQIPHGGKTAPADQVQTVILQTVMKMVKKQLQESRVKVMKEALMEVTLQVQEGDKTVSFFNGCILIFL